MENNSHNTPASSDRGIAYEQVFNKLYHSIITGRYEPGLTLTIRGLADEMSVSPMPVREAVRRLVTLGALTMHSTRRVSVSNLTEESFAEVCAARYMLEPELAVRAMPYQRLSQLKQMYKFDEEIDEAILAGDAERYSLKNWEFHFSLYNSSKSYIFVGLVESLWLKFGPFMRTVVGRVGTTLVVDQHKEIMAALEDKNEKALRQAVSLDIHDGMEAIGRELFGRLPKV